MFFVPSSKGYLSSYTFTMWATLDVNLISPQQKQGANGEWATGYLEPCLSWTRNFYPTSLSTKPLVLIKSRTVFGKKLQRKLLWQIFFSEAQRTGVLPADWLLVN